MEELYENVPLLIIGVPRGHNLLELGFHIEKIVGLKNIITSIKWKSNSNPSLSNVKLKVCSSKGNILDHILLFKWSWLKFWY